VNAGHPPLPADDPALILDVLCQHRPVHPYGIYDVANLWNVSRWWLRDRAVVGLMDLPGSPVPVVYAVSADAAEQTLALMGDLAPLFPPHFIVTGPPGLTERHAGDYDAMWWAPHLKMYLARPDDLPPPQRDVFPLDRGDVSELERFFALTVDAGAFFHPGLLDTGHYVGLRQGTELIAVAGIHVVDQRYRVAALGNVATHPAHRRRGLARAVTATLCAQLLNEVDVIGLNVRQDNAAARVLYERMGFAAVADYEEAELIAR